MSVKLLSEQWADGCAVSPHPASLLLPLCFFLAGSLPLATALGAAATLALAIVLSLGGSATAPALTGVLSGTTVFLPLAFRRRLPGIVRSG